MRYFKLEFLFVAEDEPRKADLDELVEYVMDKLRKECEARSQRASLYVQQSRQ